MSLQAQGCKKIFQEILSDLNMSINDVRVAPVQAAAVLSVVDDPRILAQAYKAFMKHSGEAVDAPFTQDAIDFVGAVSNSVMLRKKIVKALSSPSSSDQVHATMQALFNKPLELDDCFMSLMKTSSYADDDVVLTQSIRKTLGLAHDNAHYLKKDTVINLLEEHFEKLESYSDVKTGLVAQTVSSIARHSDVEAEPWKLDVLQYVAEAVLLDQGLSGDELDILSVEMLHEMSGLTLDVVQTEATHYMSVLVDEVVSSCKDENVMVAAVQAAFDYVDGFLLDVKSEQLTTGFEVSYGLLKGAFAQVSKQENLPVDYLKTMISGLSELLGGLENVYPKHEIGFNACILHACIEEGVHDVNISREIAITLFEASARVCFPESLVDRVTKKIAVKAIDFDLSVQTRSMLFERCFDLYKEGAFKHEDTIVTLLSALDQALDVLDLTQLELKGMLGSLILMNYMAANEENVQVTQADRDILNKKAQALSVKYKDVL